LNIKTLGSYDLAKEEIRDIIIRNRDAGDPEKFFNLTWDCV